MTAGAPDPGGRSMHKIIKWERDVGHEPGMFRTVKCLQPAHSLFERRWCCKCCSPTQARLCEQVSPIGNRIGVCAERKCPGIPIAFHFYPFPGGMDTGLVTT